MWAGMATSKAWETAEERASSVSSTPNHRSRGFRFDSFRLLRGQLSYSGSGDMMLFLSGVGAEDPEECDRAPLKSPYRPSASNPATTNSIFCSPSTSIHCASSHSKLVHLNNPTSGKRKKRVCHKGQAWP